jgi:hypothetical protein
MPDYLIHIKVLMFSHYSGPRFPNNLQTVFVPKFYLKPNWAIPISIMDPLHAFRYGNLQWNSEYGPWGRFLHLFQCHFLEDTHVVYSSDYVLYWVSTRFMSWPLVWILNTDPVCMYISSTVACLFVMSPRVARFFLTQQTKMGKNISKCH